MSSTLSAQIKSSIQFNVAEALDLSTVSDTGLVEFVKQIANGTTVDLSDIVWHDERSLASGANDDLNLQALTRSIYGNTVTTNFVKVKGILIINKSTTTGELLYIDTSVANGFTGWSNGSATSKAEIGPDSAFQVGSYKDGWATGGANKVLRVHNGGSATNTYRVIVIGTSA